MEVVETEDPVSELKEILNEKQLKPLLQLENEVAEDGA